MHLGKNGHIKFKFSVADIQKATVFPLDDLNNKKKMFYICIDLPKIICFSSDGFSISFWICTKIYYVFVFLCMIVQ